MFKISLYDVIFTLLFLGLLSLYGKRYYFLMDSKDIHIFKKNTFEVKNWLDLNKNDNSTVKNCEHNAETTVVEGVWVLEEADLDWNPGPSTTSSSVTLSVK